MAGIGEASAIIAVAQAGISLSMVIIAYVGDVRDAPKSVTRIGNEIKSTSGRLQEIAEIIKDNPSTGLLLDTAVGDVTRCSSECELILAQIGNLLVKGGWSRDSAELSKDDIDSSVVASLKWPFLKTRLDTPRVELQRIKADLILLFNVAMARKSSTPLTNEYARKIPLLTKKKAEAARRAEEAKQKARESQGGSYGVRTRSPRASSRPAPQLAEEDPELYQQFYEFELQRAKEQEDRRIEERAALLQVEKDNRRQAEDDAQREVAQKAVEDYKLRQEELKAKMIARESQMGEELSALGLSPEQVASILAVPSLNVEDIRSYAGARQKSTESQRTSLKFVRSLRPQRRRRSGFPIKFLPWGGNQKSQLDENESSSVESNSQGNRSSQYNRGINDQVKIELWLVDVFSQQHLELAPSERWMSRKLKRIETSHDVWHRFAQLQPMWRVAIQDFLKARNKAQRPESAWKLIHIGLPRRMTKTSIFGHHHGGQLVRLIVSRRKTANQGANSVVVVNSGNDKKSPSTVRVSTYLPRQLVSISAIRESSYDCEEMFEVSSDDAAPELADVTDETHVMIPEALTLKEVNKLASITKSFMESGREPWAAQPLFTYTVIENEVRYNDKERVYDPFGYGPDQALGRYAPAHDLVENQQQGRRPNQGPEHPRELKTKLEDSIDYLKRRRFAIGEYPGPEDQVWLNEIDTMINVLERRLAKLDPQTAKISDYSHDYASGRTRIESRSRPYPAAATRSSEEERLYIEGDFPSRNLGPVSLERGNIDRSPPSRRPSDRVEYIRTLLNRSLARRGLQVVPQDNPDPHGFIDETRNPGWVPPPPQPSSRWPRKGASESHRRGSADSEGADKRSFERTRSTPRGYEEIVFQKRDENGGGLVIGEDPIQGDEKRVVFKDRQRASHHTDYDENAYGRERAAREMIYQPWESIEKLKKKSGKEEHEHRAQIKPLDLPRPPYIKVHRKHVSPATLDAYELPWEWDERDSNYIIIKRWVPEPDQVILFEHTKKLNEKNLLFEHSKKLHEKKLLTDTKPRVGYYEEKADLERPKRGRSFEREESWADGGNSQALVLRKPRGRLLSHEYRSRQSNYDNGIRDDGIRVRGYDRSPSPSPTFSPQDRPYDARKIYIPHVPPPFDYGNKPWHEYAKFGPRPPKSFPSSIIRSRSWLHAPRSVASGDDDDGEDNDDDLPEPGNDENDKDADLIAETLSRYTTFKIDEDVTAGAKSSPPPGPDAHDDPPTKKPKDRSDEHTSHLLKKMKSTDDLRNEDLADPSVRQTRSANYIEDPVNQNTRNKKTKQDNNASERLQNGTRSSTNYLARRPSRSPSQSESEREAVRRADTQLYEADSEGSGREVKTFERTDTWRKPTVEDEDVENEDVEEEEVD